MNKLLTIVIPSYNSKKLVLSHIKKISKKFKIIIVENSQDILLKKLINKKYTNVSIYLKKNIGYGRAINYAATLIDTKYFFVINPDTKLYKNTLKRLLSMSQKIPRFGMISPEHLDNKNKNQNLLIERKMLNGAAMLFQTKIFKKIRGFDNKIFLYYEENDYFKKCNNLRLKLYTVTNCYHYHTTNGDTSSAIFQNSEEKYYSQLISGWHGQWSKFYYIKKHDGYLKSLIKCTPNLIVNIIQLILNFLIKPKKAKYIYYKIEGLLCSIIGLPSFKRSKFDKD